MKKCASCTKDLPDAALHCVFCGAKQPPAPAVQQGLGKTAFGYSANDILEQVKQGRPPRPAPAQQPPLATAPTMAQLPTSMPQPQPRPAPPSAPPMAQPPMAPPPRSPPPMAPPPMAPPYAAGPQGGFVPQSTASAKTMFVQAAPPQGPTMPSPPAPGYPQPGYPQPGYPQPGYPQPSPAAAAPTLVPPAPQAMTMPAPAPVRQPQAPIMPIPAAQPPPYLASQTASRAIRPVDPWQDSLRAMMFLWGLALLAAFATPLATSPQLVFHWTAILDGQGTARLPPLTIGAVGVLGVLLAVIPMPTAPRGLISAVLALGGIAVPIALVGLPPWQVLAPLIGVILLVPGLLIRSEYRDALLPRLLVTFGAIGVLLPLLLPQSGAIPLVSVFKALIDLPGSQKVAPALALGMLTIVVMSLLAWLPSPATGAAKLWAWLVILWALIVHVATEVVNIALASNLGDAVSHAPNATLASWVVGAGGAPGSAYVVLVGYGLAALLGKQLE
ncbi:MAG TPA: hypothetical protein VF469_06230 [Kofleriaceae bacterium]